MMWGGQEEMRLRSKKKGGGADEQEPGRLIIQ